MTTYAIRDLNITLDGRGFIVSLEVLGRQILKKPSPLVSLCRDGKILLPASVNTATGMCAADGEAEITLEDGETVTLSVREEDCCLAVTAARVPLDMDALVFGPLSVTPDEVVGDVIGVVQAGGLAFGMMAANRKTVEGVPYRYLPAFDALCGLRKEPDPAWGRVQSLHERAAAWLDGGGASLQFWAKDRSREETGRAAGAENMLIVPLPAGDPDASPEGAGVLLFGCPRKDALDRIGEIERAKGLPHPLMEDRQWVKTARGAMKSYLISDFTADEVDLALDKAQAAGMDTIYHEDPFRNWGHFDWRPDLAADDADFRAKVADRAAARGMKVGLHTLSNFTTTNDPWVTPVPDGRLVSMARLTLLSPMDGEQTEAFAENHPCFSLVQSVNAVRIGDELVTFAAAESSGEGVRLTGLVRGAFGTEKTAHPAGEAVLPLRDHGYRTLFPDINLQDEFTARLGELFNRGGAAQISYDGLEGCDYTGHEIYGSTRFVTDCHNRYDHFVLNDASRLTHFNWHVHTRMNWGEPWGEAMRTGQVETRIRNQAYFRRNLFPRMLGWFLLRTAERKFEASSREDLEWALSEAAGFDAGYAMTVRTAVMRKLGNLDLLLGLIRDWDRLRLADAFTEEQKARLRDPAEEFRLEKQDEGRYTLFPIAISAPYTCALSEMQPGQPGGADWTVDNPKEASFAFRLRVEGDGAVRDPMFATPSGVIRFPCAIGDGQYLLCDLNGTAAVTDRNYNVLERVTPQGSASLPHGASSVSFTCAHERDETPDVTVRFITRGVGEEVVLP